MDDWSLVLKESSFREGDKHDVCDYISVKQIYTKYRKTVEEPMNLFCLGLEVKRAKEYFI